jgi:hypothetical protein
VPDYSCPYPDLNSVVLHRQYIGSALRAFRSTRELAPVHRRHHLRRGSCARFLKLGFDFGKDVREVLSNKFEEEPDVQVCASALNILKRAQVFEIEDYKG